MSACVYRLTGDGMVTTGPGAPLPVRRMRLMIASGRLRIRDWGPLDGYRSVAAFSRYAGVRDLGRAVQAIGLED